MEVGNINPYSKKGIDPNYLEYRKYLQNKWKTQHYFSSKYLLLAIGVVFAFIIATFFTFYFQGNSESGLSELSGNLLQEKHVSDIEQMIRECLIRDPNELCFEPLKSLDSFELCNNLDDYSDDCFFKAASIKHDLSHCDSIQNNFLKDKCKKGLFDQ